MEPTDLENKIIYYSKEYYKGNPIISDDAFDALVDELKRINPNSKVLKTGWGFEVCGNKIKHKYSHIGSLSKTKSYKEISDRFKNKLVYLSPKLDGLSAVAYYENGILIKGITRGNGEYGKDITDKLKIILGETISDKTFTGAVRGELIISNINWQILKSLNPDLIAPRNYAAGIINRNDIDNDITYIDMVVYKIVGQEDTNIKSNRNDILLWLKNNFNHCIPIYCYDNLDEDTWNRLHKETYEEFKQLGYSLDGIVLTSPNIIYDTDSMGYLYDEEAFKFQSETAITTIMDIEWTLSRTQRLVPVAIVEPVELAGAIINRVTCNNAKMVNDLSLGRDTSIVITRSNEVIPKIVDVIEKTTLELPKYCPICGSELIWDGVDLKCPNTGCANIESSDLQCWCETIGETDGLQWTLMKQYLDNYKIKNIRDLYYNKTIILNDLYSRYLSLTELKIKEFFQKLFIDPVTIEKALVALNIPRLGEKTSILLSKNKTLVINFLIYCYNYLNGYVTDDPNLKDGLLALVKDATTISLYENINKYINLNYLAEISIMNTSAKRLIFPKEVTEVEKYIAVTGSLDTMRRKDFEIFIEKFGYQLTTNVKKCEYLISNNPSNSSKFQEAQKYKVKIISEIDFLNLLNNN